MRKQARVAAAALFFLTAFLSGARAFGQDGHFDASVNFAGAFPTSATAHGVTASATNGAELFGTFRFRFNRKHALAFNFGRLEDSQTYQTNNDFHVLTHAREYTGAYMYTPYRNSKLETFVFAGGGMLAFEPQSTWLFFTNNTHSPVGINQTQVSLGASKQTQIALLYGLGLDYRLAAIPYVRKLPMASKFAFRVQYRGLIYKLPDFNITGAGTSGPSFFTGSRGQMAEPSIGLVFKF
jgi:hypothetical protein